MAALYRSVICPCSDTRSWASVTRIDRDVKISARTAARPGSAVTEICSQSRCGWVATGRPGRANLARACRRATERGVRSDEVDDCLVRPVRLGGICLSEPMRHCSGTSSLAVAVLSLFGLYGLDWPRITALFATTRRPVSPGPDRQGRARCVPDRPDHQGTLRIVTDRPRSRRTVAMLVAALPALIPKLTVQRRSPNPRRVGHAWDATSPSIGPGSVAAGQRP